MAEIIESLSGIGYQGDCLQQSVVEEAIQKGASSTTFRALIAVLTSELGTLTNLDEEINENSEIDEFLLELSSFLKELSCPYPALVSGPISERFQSPEHRLLLLNYLTTELMAAKMCQKLNPQKQVIIEINESPSAAALKTISMNLNVGRPPQNIAPKAFFDKLLDRFNEVMKTSGNRLGQSLFAPKRQLTTDQWNQIEKFQKELDHEYNMRRDMLLTRLDVTIQSFQWSPNIKGKEDEIAQRYTSKRKALDTLQVGGKTTDIAELLAARDDLTYIEKTSSSDVRQNTRSDIQKVIIGAVPDRGGRAFEHAPPPPEMPSWQKNRSTGPAGGGFGGGKGGGGGGGGGGGYQGGQPKQQRQLHHKDYINQQQNIKRGFPDNYQRQNSSGDGFQQQSYNYQQQGNNYQQSNNYQPNQSYSNRGNSRVQGGWSQSGAGGNHDYNNRQRNDYGGNSGGYQQQQNNQGFNRPQDNYNRNNNSSGGSVGSSVGSGAGRGVNRYDNRGDNPNNRRGQSNYNRGGRR